MESVIDVTKESIQQVVDASMQKLVVLVFWSQQSPESVTLLETLQAIVTSNDGQLLLAKVDSDVEVEIGQYFQVQSLPTTLILSEGKPVDGFAGLQDRQQIQTVLDKYLPKAWQIQLDQAKLLLANDEFDQALPLLKLAYQECQQAEVTLVYADALLSSGDMDHASELLDTLGLADQNSDYHSIKAKLSLAIDAADTPEIRSLFSAVAANPEDLSLLLDLAKSLNAAKRDEEALAKLYLVLQTDINAHNGEIKQLFMEILTALGQSSSTANQYRRKLYSLLY